MRSAVIAVLRLKLWRLLFRRLILGERTLISRNDTLSQPTRRFFKSCHFHEGKVFTRKSRNRRINESRVSNLMSANVMPDFIYTLGSLTENEKRSLSLSLFSRLLSFTKDHDRSGSYRPPTFFHQPGENHCDGSAENTA